MPDTCYSFDITTLVVPFSKSKISYSIRIVPEVIINNDTFKFAILT